MKKDLRLYEDHLTGAMENRLTALSRNTESLRRELVHLSPASRIRDRRMYTAQCADKLSTAMERKIRDARIRADRSERLQNRMDRKLSESVHRMQVFAAQLEQRSPVAKLSGGYICQRYGRQYGILRGTGGAGLYFEHTAEGRQNRDYCERSAARSAVRGLAIAEGL